MIATPGFGCASLGSRVSAQNGIGALERAYDAGVRWYDVAPSYGDGKAEEILGEFLRGRRTTINLCTKVGILPPKPSLPKRLVRPIVRTALTLAPGLRQTVRRHRPTAVKPPLDAAAILPSLERSLRRLGTDYVDVLALHEATLDEVIRDDVLRALEAVLASGKARRIALATSAQAVIAGLNASSIYGVAQVANNPFEPMLDRIARALPSDGAVTTVTHTVFGASGMIERLAELIRTDATFASALAAAGYSGGRREQALTFLTDYAFATNPTGVVLLSMFSRGHLEANLARLSHIPTASIMRAIAAHVLPRQI